MITSHLDAPLNVQIVLSSAARARIRVGRYRNALKNLSLIDIELARISMLLKDDPVMAGDHVFMQVLSGIRRDVDLIQFYLDCGAFEAQKYGRSAIASLGNQVKNDKNRYGK